MNQKEQFSLFSPENLSLGLRNEVQQEVRHPTEKTPTQSVVGWCGINSLDILVLNAKSRSEKCKFLMFQPTSLSVEPLLQEPLISSRRLEQGW